MVTQHKRATEPLKLSLTTPDIALHSGLYPHVRTSFLLTREKKQKRTFMDELFERDKKIAFNEIVKAIFPEIELTKLRSHMAGLVGNKFDITIQNNFLMECWPHAYQSTNCITHFTSLRNAVNIIKEKQIRAYNLDKFEDPMEFYYYFSKIKTNPVKEYKIFRQGTFVFSAIETKLLNEMNSLHFWRAYGDNGLGCALDFEVNLNKTPHFGYGNVIYNLPPIKNIKKGLKNFKEMSNGKEFDADPLFKIASCYYKHPSYTSEQEVRLFSVGNIITQLPEINQTFSVKPYADIHNGNIVHYTTIPLSKGLIIREYPYLILKKIRFGPRISDKNYSELVHTFRSLYSGNLYNNELQCSKTKIPWK